MVGKTIGTKFHGRSLPLPNILETIGQTPMVKLNRIPQSEGIQCQVFAKCEFINPGGSVKDRIAKLMIEEAERQGVLIPGRSVIIEPTSGNTGIGLAMAGAIKGYRVIITLPEKMSDEKVNLLMALGAEVHRTPTEAAWNDPDSHISLAKRLRDSIPDAVILDQYSNPANPLAHQEETAQELWEQMEGKVDMVVAGAGTGGTIAGLEKKLRSLNSSVVLVGVDPKGSLLAGPCETCYPYLVEGIGYDFIPDVLNPKKIDCWVKTEDHESFLMARRLIREEGLLAGGSCGAAMVGAIKAIKQSGWAEDPTKRVAVILPDSIRNYMSKFLSDDWMQRHEMPRVNTQVQIQSDLKIVSPVDHLKKVKAVGKDQSLNRLLEELHDSSDLILVLDERGEAYGYVNNLTILKRIVNIPPQQRQSLTASRLASREFGLIDDLSQADAIALISSGVTVMLKRGAEFYLVTPKDVIKSN